MFLTTGAPNVVYKTYIPTSFTQPEAISKRQQQKILLTDTLDPVEDDLLLTTDITLTPEEQAALYTPDDTF